MRNMTNISHQEGVALFVGLIMLLVMTVLGISGFQNSHIQERAAGNARLQSVAFEAAAAGASNAINFYDSQRDSLPDNACGDNDHEGWADPTDWVAVGSVGDATVKQRMYCLADTYPCSEDEVDCDARPPRSQLFVLSRGEVTIGENVVAMRDVEVRLDIGHDYATGDGCGALCFPSCNPGSFTFPNSNVFQVDGENGYAITGGCDDMSNAILDGISGNRIGNYHGGVGTAGPGSPWDTPENTENFRSYIEATASAQQTSDPASCQTLCYTAGNHSDYGNSEYGTVDNMQITYIGGNASFGGNVSGAGIMFVAGTLAWNGTPDFQGLIVTLGGTFQIDGGGLGGDHGGSVVILNHTDGSTPFGESSFTNIGGGTAQYNYDCAILQMAQSTLLDADGQAMWNPECSSGPGNPYQAGPREMVIASWRENIGWREGFFGSEGAAEE